MSGVHVLMLTTSRRRARARVLEESLRQVHPEAVITKLWCDARLAERPGSDVLVAQRLDLGVLRYADLVLMGGEKDAGWAVMPWAVAELARAGATGPFVVVDDSFVVLDRLDTLMDAGSAVARSRHVDGATGQGWGGAQPGVLVIDDSEVSAVHWWRSRVLDWVTTPGAADRSAGAPVEHQPLPWWSPLDAMDLCVDPRFRLCAASTDEVVLDLDGDSIVTNEGPLALADMAHLDPTMPWWFAPDGELPRRAVSTSPALRELCARVARLLDEAEWDPGQEVADEMLLPGVDATPALRRWFGDALRAGEDPPNPYVSGEVDAFVTAMSGPGRADGTGVSLGADLLRDSRADLQRAFDSPRWRDRRSFRQWLWTSGLDEGQVALSTLQETSSPFLVAPHPPARTRDVPKPFGVNLVGYLGAELGLGVAARQMLRALEAAGVPTSTVTYDRTSSPQGSISDGSTDRPYHFNLLLIVPDQLPLFVADVGTEFFGGHQNIGLWYWESDVMKENQLAAFDFVDEVWAATTYLQRAFSSAGRVPVSVVPSPLVFETPGDVSSARKRLGLDDRFTFLFSFDFLSVVERKNPLGLLDAYRRAFGPDDGTRLILKSINGDVFPREKERIAAAIADHADVELWDRMLPAADRLALVAAADCYVSLHRAEGLGLTMAEAMAVGTPVVATGYSGNLDFMDDRSALLVPYDLVEVGPGSHYPAHGRWAAPDLDAAASLMASVRGDAQLRAGLVQAATAALEPFAYEQVGRIARDRLVGAWQDRSTGQSR